MRRDSPTLFHTVTQTKRSVNGPVSYDLPQRGKMLTNPDRIEESGQVNHDTDPDNLPPIRRPVLFYTTVCVAFGLLGGAILLLSL